MVESEVLRRMVHASGAVVPLGYVSGIVEWGDVVGLFVVLTGVVFVLEVVRLVMGIDWWVYRRLTREYEQSNVAGYALYSVGATATVVVFDPVVAVPALFMLMIADPVSGLLGSNTPRNPKRPVVLGVMFGVCFGFAVWFVSVPAAVVGAVVATVADGMTPVVKGHVIDDNLTIPIGAASAMWVMVMVVPG